MKKAIISPNTLFREMIFDEKKMSSLWSVIIVTFTTYITAEVIRTRISWIISTESLAWNLWLASLLFSIFPLIFWILNSLLISLLTQSKKSEYKKIFYGVGLSMAPISLGEILSIPFILASPGRAVELPAGSTVEDLPRILSPFFEFIESPVFLIGISIILISLLWCIYLTNLFIKISLGKNRSWAYSATAGSISLIAIAVATFLIATYSYAALEKALLQLLRRD
ncbi:MAG: YIP1 family protein [Candidatus Methanodesulfokora sp.]|jgi:hypothetical protein